MTVKRALIYFICPVVSSSKFIVIYHFPVSNESELAPERIFPAARLPVCAVMLWIPVFFSIIVLSLTRKREWHKVERA
jgi:hypothetical protein